ncbi:AMP-binding protein [Chelatococcus reniformis]|nr:AMP-binding protein [Chelatococcus reniformis]
MPQALSPYPQRGIDENLELQARVRPAHTAIVFYGRELSYAALWRDVEALAGFLARELGVRPGDRVAVDLQNSPHYVIAFYATLRAGAVVVPLNPMYRADEVGAILTDSGVTVAIVAADLVDRFSGWAGAERLRLVVARYADALPPEPVAPTPAFMHLPAPDLAADPRLVSWAEAVTTDCRTIPRNQPGSLCVMPYTSGSTGRPKGCPHTHASVMHTAALQAEWYELSPASVATAVQPLFHVAGMQATLNGGIYAGATLLIMARWDAAAAVELFSRYRPTFFNAPPTMVIDLLAQPSFTDRALDSVKVVSGGGTAMPVAVAEQLERRFGLVYIEGYGMSETMSPTHLNPIAAPRAGSVGVTVPQTVACIVDPETLAPLPDGEVGEILVAGPQMISGYWNNPDADRQAFAVVGGRRMLRTGDLGHRTADGYYHVVDRLKRMINASGFKVWPAEVEGLLFAHEAVAQCCVIAAPDAYRGETVKALIVLKPQAKGKVGEADIIGWARERLAVFKVPRQVEFVDSLPLTASNKVDWRALQAQAAAHAP